MEGKMKKSKKYQGGRRVGTMTGIPDWVKPAPPTPAAQMEQENERQRAEASKKAARRAMQTGIDKMNRPSMGDAMGGALESYGRQHAMKKGGKVKKSSKPRGSGCAKRGVRKAKMY